MFDNWVTRYAMSYSTNGKHWLMVTEGSKRDSSPRVSANITHFSLKTSYTDEQKLKMRKPKL